MAGRVMSVWQQEEGGGELSVKSSACYDGIAGGRPLLSSGRSPLVRKVSSSRVHRHQWR